MSNISKRLGEDDNVILPFQPSMALCCTLMQQLVPQQGAADLGASLTGDIGHCAVDIVPAPRKGLSNHSRNFTAQRRAHISYKV